MNQQRFELAPDAEGLHTVTVIALYFHSISQAGGAERMICQVANELSLRGLDVHLLSLDPPSAKAFYSIGPGINWHRLGLNTDLGGKLQRLLKMAAIIRKNHVRVVIGFVMSGDKTVYAASRIGGSKLVAAERNGPSMYRLRHGALQRWQCFCLLHLCDAVTVQFSAYRQGYPRSLHKRMVAIPNPVTPGNQTATPDRPADDGRFQLLAVSRLDGIQKRLDCLIHAFARAASVRPDWDLRIIGEGRDEAALRNLVEDLGLNHRVMLEPSTKHIHAAYAEANLFVMPSRWEGFPNALAEALSVGLPAVGFSEAEGVAHLISQGKTGWLVRGKNETTALTNTLLEAMSDHEERRTRGAMAVREMSEFRPEVQYDLWAGLIQRLASER